jgi:hypothetical protein
MFIGDRPCIREGPRQSIKLRDNKRVAFSTSSQGLTQAGPFAVGPSQAMVDVDLVGGHSERR